jgi:rhamnulokinase
VDFALLGRDDELLGNPYHYRDRRTEGMMEEAFRRIPQKEIFERTGIQFMPINSLYMLLSMAGSPALAAAATFLMIPDLFNFWLSGHKACEFTDATTTQLYDQAGAARPYLLTRHPAGQRAGADPAVGRRRGRDERPLTPAEVCSRHRPGLS